MEGLIDWVAALERLDWDLQADRLFGTNYVKFDRRLLMWTVVELESWRTVTAASKKEAMVMAGASLTTAEMMSSFCGFDKAMDAARRDIMALSVEAGDDFVQALTDLEERCARS